MTGGNFGKSLDRSVNTAHGQLSRQASRCLFQACFRPVSFSLDLVSSKERFIYIAMAARFCERMDVL